MGHNLSKSYVLIEWEKKSKLSGKNYYFSSFFRLSALTSCCVVDDERRMKKKNSNSVSTIYNVISDKAKKIDYSYK